MADTTSTMTTDVTVAVIPARVRERIESGRKKTARGVGEGDAVASFTCEFDFRGETEAEFGCGGGVGAEIAGESG